MIAGRKHSRYRKSFRAFSAMLLFSRRQKFIRLLAAPPVVHIGFVKLQISVPQDPVVQTFVMNLNIQRAVAVDLHTGLNKEFLDDLGGHGFCFFRQESPVR